MSKYQRKIAGINKKDGSVTAVIIDVYDVLKAFGVTCPALQHLVKKALCAGIRGHKNIEEDLDNVLESARRAIELNCQDIQIEPNFGPGHSTKKNACDLSCSTQCAKQDAKSKELNQRFIKRLKTYAHRPQSENACDLSCSVQCAKPDTKMER